jgi:hypothetical protein
MPNFKFASIIVVEATSDEDALYKIAGHLGTVARQISEPGVTVADVDRSSGISLTETEDEVTLPTLPTYLRPGTQAPAIEQAPPAPLNLDWESPEGKAHHERMGKLAPDDPVAIAHFENIGKPHPRAAEKAQEA